MIKGRTWLSFKILQAVLLLSAAACGLSGCASGMATLECGLESMNPTVMGSLDSFESAAISIKLSNRVLLETPLSEQDSWPNDLFGVPSGSTLLKMGLSAFASSQGITLATEVDPEIGWPRPTSALYIFLKEREKLLDKHVNQNDVQFFRSQPRDVFYRPLGNNIKPDTINPFTYRNPLMAYGVVTNNKQEMLQLEEEINLVAQGYTTCDAFLRNADTDVTEEIKKAACKDPALTSDAITIALQEKTEDMALMQQNYGKLANKVHSASLAGADFSMAALVKIGCAVVNGVRAFPNIGEEFKNLRGVYNAALVFPRIKMIFESLGIYKDNLGLQYTVYKTMYQQIKGKYKLEEEQPGQKKNQAVLQRLEQAETILARLEPKIQLALTGSSVQFTDAEVMELQQVAALFEKTEPLVFLAASKP